MGSPTRSASLVLLSALAIAACGDDGSTAITASSGSGGAGGESSSSTRSSGQGGDGEPSSSSTASSSPTTGSQSGGGEGGAPSGPGGTGGDITTTSVVGGGDPGSGGNTGSGGDGGGGGPPPCAAGVIQCDGTVQQVCDGNGGFTDVVDCAPGGCVPGVGCTVCQPGTASCNGNVSSVCNGSGTGYDVYECDPLQGSVCDVGTGHCTGACSPEIIGESYIGCDYYPTVTLNSQLQNTFFSSEGTYAIAVANTSDDATEVLVTRGAATITSTTVAANSVQIIPLPWVYELKNTASTQLLADGAYRVRTTRPVTVYQYNPIEYSTPDGNTYTNDASLLLPTNAWTGTYRVASRNAWRTLSGFYTVVARQDGTTVTLTRSATSAVIAGAGVQSDGNGTVLLNEGDVLQVVSTTNGSDQQGTDLTGSLVTADRPVQVFGGHDCTNVPFNIPYCDHIEESMPPVETLSTEYIVTPPLSAAGGTDAEYVRVIATEANTTLAYDPPQGGAPTTLTNAGDFFEIANTSADFVITSDKAVLVAQYMQGQGDTGIPGDPAEALAVATEQYRDEYLFHAPTNYLSNYVNITAPIGATIVLDGNVVNGFVAIGASGYASARVQLSNAGDGNHSISGDEEFGISVYGYGDDTSYWYPGGLDLDRVN